MSEAPPPGEERFSRRQVLRILGIHERQLAWWERQGLIEPFRPLAPEKPVESPEPVSREPRDRGEGGGARGNLYSFSDIVALRTLVQLRKHGIPTSRIRLAHSALKAKLAGIRKPLSELQIESRGKRLAVYFQGQAMDPLSGQLLLEYRSRENPPKVRTLDRVSCGKLPLEEDKGLRAERFFRAGLRYEENEETLPKAIRAYQKAIELNPTAVGALINLGTLYYKQSRLQEAEECYRAALSIQPEYALVHFNLGNVFDERNEWDQARQHYEEAIRLDPGYPDPRFNLALIHEKSKEHGKARLQWRAYLKLDSQSHWAAYARQQLDNAPFHIVPPRRSSEERS